MRNLLAVAFAAGQLCLSVCRNTLGLIWFWCPVQFNHPVLTSVVSQIDHDHPGGTTRTRARTTRARHESNNQEQHFGWLSVCLCLVGWTRLATSHAYVSAFLVRHHSLHFSLVSHCSWSKDMPPSLFCLLCSF